MRRLLVCVLILALTLCVAVAPASAATRANRDVTRSLSALQPFSRDPEPGSMTGLAVAPEVGALAEMDDTIPGLPRQWWPGTFTDTVDAATDAWDFYPVWLEWGEEAEFTLTSSAGDFALKLFYPSGALVEDPLITDEHIAGTAHDPGYWYVGVQARSGSGSYKLDGWFTSPDDDLYLYADFATPDLPASPVGDRLDSFSDWDDVSKVWLNTGDRITMTLSTAAATAGFDPDIYLWGPEATSIYEPNVWIVDTEDQPLFPKTLTYTATQPGYHYVDLYVYPNDSGTIESGNTALTYSIDRVPMLNVYRFYNARLGTHFYTADETEKSNVIATLGSIFTFEGPAYSVNPTQNTTPLYRFYNRRTGTHFYTASESEKATVIATLGYIFTFEGVAYNVSGAPGVGRTPVYRFYNVRTGTHFYTATAAERDNVIATLGTIYRYEGEGFWYGL